LSEFEKWFKRNWNDYSFTKWHKEFGHRLVGKWEGDWRHNSRIVLIYHFTERRPTIEDFASFLKDFERFYDDYESDYNMEGAYLVLYGDYEKETFNLLLKKSDEELRDLVRIKSFEEKPTIVPTRTSEQREGSKKGVFIVHGRDKAPAFELARLLEREFRLETTLLQEQPHSGRTLIEKLEDYSNVEYAFVIVTPDDVGGLKGEELRERPRQNVILEWGHFIAKIGRNKTCILLKGNIELPSDMQGAGYHRFNDSVEEVFLKIKRELKDADLID